MQITKKNLTDTKVQLTLVADTELLAAIKQATLAHLAKDVKIQGFRGGKAPISMIEKSIDPTRLASEFVDRAMNAMYIQALDQEQLRPVEQPQVKVTKFVPFDTLELEAEVSVVGNVTLPDYKKMRIAREKVAVTAKEIDAVLADLRKREAEKKETNRAAKDGDEVIIDFKGTDAKTKEAIAGADGTNYPLGLGSGAFIPGFEPEIVGLKAGDQKTFTVTFPKDYGAPTMQNRKVTFAVTVKTVNEVVEAKLDDAFAAKVGPFKTVAELKDDIKKELQERKEDQGNQAYADEVLTKITEKAKVAIPEVLIDEQLQRIEQDQRQNLMYQGQTWPEYLAAEGLNEKTYREKQRPAAELRVKAGLVLSAISEKEKIDASDAEIDAQMQRLAAQYPDPKMREELAKPETRRTVVSRLLTDKTIAKLTEYTSAK